MAFHKTLMLQHHLYRLLSSNRALACLFNRQFFHSDNDKFGEKNGTSLESSDDFERRLFGDTRRDGKDVSFYNKLDMLERVAHGKSNSSSLNGRNDSRIIDGLSDSFNTLSDGMDEKLNKAAQTFVYSDEIHEEDYKFRPDVTFYPGNTYTKRGIVSTLLHGLQHADTLENLHLDHGRILILRSPGSRSPPEEINLRQQLKRFLRKLISGFYLGIIDTLRNKKGGQVDLQLMLNVRFLSNFLTEAGIIIKRSQTRISAKAQRRVAREIKTARAFGLMPFTTMGTKSFVFGRSMKDEEEDYEYVANEPNVAPDSYE